MYGPTRGSGGLDASACRRRLRRAVDAGGVPTIGPAAVAALVAAIAVLLLPAPAFAQATTPALTFSWPAVAALVIAGCAGLLAILAVRAHRQLEKYRRAWRAVETSGRAVHTAFAAAGGGVFSWTGTEAPVASPSLVQVLGLDGSGRQLSFRDLQAVFDPAGAGMLEEGARQLRERGAAFTKVLRSADRRRHFQVVGRRSSGDGAEVDLLWIQDITEKMAPLVHLEREGRRLRSLLDGLPIPIWNRDGDLRITDCNTAYVRAVEAHDRQTVIEEGRELAEGELTERTRALAVRALEQGVPQSEQHHIVFGGMRHRFDIAEVPNAARNQTIGYALDTTEIEQLRKDVNRFITAHEDVLDRLATAIMVLDADKRLHFFNGAFAKMWGLDEHWLETRPELSEVLDALHERRLLPETGDFSGFKRDWDAHFTSLTAPHQELMHLPNNQSVWMVIAPHPMGGLLFTFEDVTYRLVLERSYNTLVDVQRATLDHLSDGVAVFGEDGCLRLSNPAFRSLWGLDAAAMEEAPHVTEVIEACRPHLDFGGDWGRARASFTARVIGRMTRSGRINRTDGTMLAYGIVPLPDGGVLLSFRDISDTVRVQRALRERNEALEAADRLKSDFVANISYELRTPLNTIIGFTEILTNEYFGKLNERQSEYASGVLEASQRLLALINDILDLAVIEAGRMMLEISELPVRNLLHGVLGLTSEWARERKIALNLDCPDDVGAIEGDERRLRHALFNLVSNAIKFTPPGGHIVLSARRAGGEVAIRVRDSGIGIAEADQAHVFGKFVRGTGSRGRSQGVGLGLSLVKSFVELHGGRMQLSSRPGRGTVVTCFLPVSQRGRGDAARIRAGKDAGSGTGGARPEPGQADARDRPGREVAAE